MQGGAGQGVHMPKLRKILVYQAAIQTVFCEFCRHSVELERETCTNGFGTKNCVSLPPLAYFAAVTICWRNIPRTIVGFLRRLQANQLYWASGTKMFFFRPARHIDISMS